MALDEISTSDSGSLAHAGANKVEAAYTAVPTDEGSESRPLPGSHKTRWYEKILLDTWIPEVLAIAFSTSCLAAILVILLVFNGRTSPELRYGITLNAIVSALATASRSALIYAVATSISQLKWCWIQKRSRDLQDLQIYDDASRGPWGSLTMLMYLRLRPVASIGAVITILALALDPFVQQVLRYPTRMVASSQSAPALSRAQAFSADPGSDEWRNAVQFGIYSEPSQFDRQPGCPTGNCHWPAFKSVGWCTKCEDATSYATLSDCNTDVLSERPGNQNSTGCAVSFGRGNDTYLYRGLPDYSVGNSVGEVGSYPSWSLAMHSVWSVAESDGSRANSTYTALGVPDPILSLRRVSVDSRDPPYPYGEVKLSKAEECVLSLCVKYYSVTVQNGTTHTTATGEDQFGRRTRQACDDQLITSSRFCWRPDGEAMPAPDHQSDCDLVPEIENDHTCLLALDDYYPRDDTFKWTMLESLTGNRTYDDPGQLQKFSNPAVGTIVANGLSNTLVGVAASLSRLALSNHTAAVQGTAMATETYVHVTLYWLVLPFALEFGGAILLLIAIIQSWRYKVKPWKSSLLPLLYHGLEERGLGHSTACGGAGADHSSGTSAAPEQTSAMSAIADQVKVQLGWSEKGGKSVLKVV